MSLLKHFYLGQYNRLKFRDPEIRGSSWALVENLNLAVADLEYV